MCFLRLSLCVSSFCNSSTAPTTGTHDSFTNHLTEAGSAINTTNDLNSAEHLTADEIEGLDGITYRTEIEAMLGIIDFGVIEMRDGKHGSFRPIHMCPLPVEADQVAHDERAAGCSFADEEIVAFTMHKQRIIAAHKAGLLHVSACGNGVLYLYCEVVPTTLFLNCLMKGQNGMWYVFWHTLVAEHGVYPPETRVRCDSDPDGRVELKDIEGERHQISMNATPYRGSGISPVIHPPTGKPWPRFVCPHCFKMCVRSGCLWCPKCTTYIY